MNVKQKILKFVYLLKEHLKKFGKCVHMFYPMELKKKKIKLGKKNLKMLIIILVLMDKEFLVLQKFIFLSVNIRRVMNFKSMTF